VKHILMMIEKRSGGLTAGAFAAMLYACASTGPSQQLRDARSAYDDAEDGPAETHAPAALENARVALHRAEAAHDEDPGSARERRLAEEAERRAEIADARGEAVQAERNAVQARARLRAEARRDRPIRDRSVVDRRSTLAKVDPDPYKERDTPERRAREVERVEVDRTRARDDAQAVAALQGLSQVANVKQEPRGVVITLSGELLFPTGDEKLSPIANQSMDRVADALAVQPASAQIVVQGHTDDRGSESQNERLSKARAQAVAGHLIDNGIAAERIGVVGYGESRPIASNDTAEGRATNRRVEIVVGQQVLEPGGAQP